MTGWLDQVPAEWEVVSPRRHFQERREPSRPDDVHLTPSQHHGVLPQTEYMELTGSRVVLNLTGADNMKHVEPGDTIGHLRSFQGGLETSPLAGKVSNAYTVIRSGPDADHGYFRWVFKSAAFVQELAAHSQSLRDGQSVKYEDLASIDLPMPPLDEQRRIADFLDDRVSRIDRIIAARREQVQLIEEQFASRRANAVRGADSPLQRVDGWLGWISQDWDSRRLGSIVRFYGGAAFPHAYQGSGKGDLPFVKVGDLARADVYGRLGDAANWVSTLVARSLGASTAPPEAILFPKVGAALLTNRRVMTHRTVVFDNNVMGVWFLGQGDSRYWFHVLSCIDMAEISNPGPVPSIGRQAVAELHVPVPPDFEQRSIGKEMDTALSVMRQQQGGLHRSISLMTEYKSSLITAAVTGGLDVSTAGSSIPG